MLDYAINILYALDKLVNATLGGRHDETVSDRLEQWYSADGWRSVVARPLCWFINGIHPEHIIIEVRDDGRDV